LDFFQAQSLRRETANHRDFHQMHESQTHAQMYATKLEDLIASKNHSMRGSAMQC
jgi:hypothetical protein